MPMDPFNMGQMKQLFWSYNWMIIFYGIASLITICAGAYLTMWIGRVLSRLASYFDAKARREEIELTERTRLLEEEAVLRRVKPKKPPGDDDRPYMPKM